MTTPARKTKPSNVWLELVGEAEIGEFPLGGEVPADDAIEFRDGLPKVAPFGRLQLRSLATVQPRQVRWLVPGLIPLRTLTLVAGVGGLGKSTWLANVAAQVSRGGLLNATPGNVIIVSYEDAAEEVLRPRIEAAGGDLDRVHDIVLQGVAGIDPVQLPRDIDELERLAQSVEARLVIVDPIVAAFDTALDAHKDQHVRHVLARLTKLAEERSCAVPIVGHLNKAPSTDAYIRVANSVAFWNASRSVVLVTEDEGDHRLVAQRKANYARLHPVERHKIEEIELPGTLDPDTGKPIVTSRMVFLEFAEDVDGADVLASRSVGAGEKETKGAAFLAGSLWDGEWHDSAGLKTLAAAQGISERTLQRTANELEIEAKRRGFPSSTWWRLASRATGTPENDGATVEPASLSQNQGIVAPVAPELFGDATDGATTDDKARWDGLLELEPDEDEAA